MGAYAAAERAAGAPARPHGLAPHGLALRLAAGARAHPQRTALRDAGDRAAWCGRPAITWSYAAAAEIVGRLARGIGAWRLPVGSRVGLWFSGGAESALAHLAVEAAGHLPCPMPAAWDAERLSAGIEAAGLVAVLTEGRAGPRRPAEDLARVATGHFGLRYLAAFGPGVPDGVISLDALALERGVAEPVPGRGLVTFADGDPARPVFRTAGALAAAVGAHLDGHADAGHPAAGEARILTLLPGHDLRGLVTGLGAALAAGAGLETLIPFDGAAFRASLLRPVPTRLVVPAAIEPALDALPLPWTVRALDVAHRAPARLRARPAPDPAGPRRRDALALGEDAVLTRPRGGGGLAATLAGLPSLFPPDLTFPVVPGAADPVPPMLPPQALARRADGRLVCRGPACAAAPLPRGAPADPDPAAWRISRYRLRAAAADDGARMDVIPADDVSPADPAPNAAPRAEPA